MQKLLKRGIGFLVLAGVVAASAELAVDLLYRAIDIELVQRAAGTSEALKLAVASGAVAVQK